LDIPETDNERNHADYADSVQNMPGELAARWANEEAKWLSVGF